MIRRLADGGRLLELAPRWARNMFTAFARIDGRPVGVIANQPRHLAGCIDSAAAEKAARFVRTLQLVRAAAGGAGRHARASCPARARSAQA